VQARDEVTQGMTSMADGAGREDPADWFGFRLRAWDAWDELHRSESPEAVKTTHRLKEIWAVSPAYVYEAARFFRQKLAGLRKRLRGTREGSAARMGRLTSAQKRLIQQAGYGVVGWP